MNSKSWLARHLVENENLQNSERSSPKACFSHRGGHSALFWTLGHMHTHGSTQSHVYTTLSLHIHMNYFQDLRDSSGSSPGKVRHKVAAVYNPSVAMVTWEAETGQFLEALGPAADILQGQTGDRFRQGGRDHQLSDLHTWTHTKYFQIFTKPAFFPSIEYKLVHFKK